MNNYPDGCGPNTKGAPWNPPEMTEWEPADTEDQPDYCVECDEVDILDENGVCHNCFEPEEIVHEKEYDKYEEF